MFDRARQISAWSVQVYRHGAPKTEFYEIWEYNCHKMTYALQIFTIFSGFMGPAMLYNLVAFARN